MIRTNVSTRAQTLSLDLWLRLAKIRPDFGNGFGIPVSCRNFGIMKLRADLHCHLNAKLETATFCGLTQAIVTDRESRTRLVCTALQIVTSRSPGRQMKKGFVY
jgi:hypothetical protein